MTCPYASLHVLAALCTPINGGGVDFDPLPLALVVLIFNHCAHVLLGTCGGQRVLVLGSTVVLHGCRIKGLDTLPWKSHKSDPEHGAHCQPHTLKFSNCL